MLAGQRDTEVDRPHQVTADRDGGKTHILNVLLTGRARCSSEDLNEDVNERSVVNGSCGSRSLAQTDGWTSCIWKLPLTSRA